MNQIPMIKKALSISVMVGATLFGMGAQVHADEFPNGPIEVINNSKPGGGTDVFLRFATEGAGEILGTDMLVLSKTGGVATNALKYVDSKPRDGQTIFSLLPGHLLTLMRGTTDLTLDDIVPVVRGSVDPALVVVKSDTYKDIQNLIDSGKSGSIKMGGTKVGGNAHVGALLFAKKADLNQVYVPFQGSGEIAINLISGRIDVALLNYDEIESHLKQGTVEVLAVLSDKRLGALPDVPTGAEVGVPVNVVSVRGIGVLKGTPEDRIDMLENALLEGMKTEDYIHYLEGSGQTTDSIAGREEWTAQIKEMYANYQEVGEELKLVQSK
jgi:putative tricarboxylic transport membrane protein